MEYCRNGGMNISTLAEGLTADGEVDMATVKAIIDRRIVKTRENLNGNSDGRTRTEEKLHS